jgi:hypothetical protein
MLGLAFRRLEEQRLGSGEFAGEFGRVHGGEECVYPVRETMKA